MICRMIRVAAFVVIAVATACSGGDGGDSTPGASPTVADSYTYGDAIGPGPHAVTSAAFEFIDTSRGTMANGDEPARPERTIPVEVWYPATAGVAGAPVDASAGPYPLIVWAHGFSSLPQFTALYLSHLASHGYVVAGPAFPLTKFRAPGGTNFLDTFNQDDDVSFVIDELLRANEDAANILNGAIDVESIGLIGHSGGSFTTLLVLYGDDHDPRIDAAVPISASACFLEPSMFERTNTPTMFIVGTADQLFTVDGIRYAYDSEGAPRYWVAIEGANHTRFTGVDVDDSVAAGIAETIRSVGAAVKGPSPTNLLAGCVTTTSPSEGPALTLERQQELLRAFTTPFFDAFLKDDAAARDFLEGGTVDAATVGAVAFEFDVE